MARAGWWRPEVRGIVCTLLLLILGFLVLYPLALLLLNSFQLARPGAPPVYGLQGWQQAFTQPGIRAAVLNTLSLTAAQVAISTVAAVGAAWLIARTDVAKRNWLEFGFWTAYFLPTLPVVLAWILLLDPVHNALLHHPQVNESHNYRGFHGGRGPIPGVQVLECEPTDFGVALCYTSPNDAETKNIRTFNFVMPNLTMFPGTFRGHDGFSCNWHVPIDDTRHWKYTFIFRRSGPIDAETQLARLGSVGPGYRLIQNKGNRYLQDRSLLATASYSGIPNVAAQDTWATEGEGAIQDRTHEYLGYSDKIIVMARRMMLKAIQDVQHGDDPPHVIRHPDQNHFPHLVVRGDQVPPATDWQEFRKEIAGRNQTVAAAG